MTYTSRWEGNALVTTIPGPAVNRTEKRSIEADGTMKVRTHHHDDAGQAGAPAARWCSGRSGLVDPADGQVAGAGVVRTRARAIRANLVVQSRGRTIRLAA